jgi:hypothetical protein
MTAKTLTHQILANVAEEAMSDGLCPERTWVASPRGDVLALDRRRAG